MFLSFPSSPPLPHQTSSVFHLLICFVHPSDAVVLFHYLQTGSWSSTLCWSRSFQTNRNRSVSPPLRECCEFWKLGTNITGKIKQLDSIFHPPLHTHTCREAGNDSQQPFTLWRLAAAWMTSISRACWPLTLRCLPCWWEGEESIGVGGENR